MTFTCFAARSTKKLDQTIACILAGLLRTRLICPARFVNLASCNPRKSKTRPFSAPDRAITVPNMGRSANKGQPGGYYRYQTHFTSLFAANSVAIPVEVAGVSWTPIADRSGASRTRLPAIGEIDFGAIKQRLRFGDAMLDP